MTHLGTCPLLPPERASRSGQWVNAVSFRDRESAPHHGQAALAAEAPDRVGHDPAREPSAIERVDDRDGGQASRRLSQDFNDAPFYVLGVVLPQPGSPARSEHSR